jgi:Na+/melibiose symporter-like transporter
MAGTACFIIGAVPISFMMNIYLFECMDYGEWKLGTRVEGVMGSVNSFMAKLASALSGALQGFLIAIIGYVGTAETQSPGTLTGITVLYNFVPLLLVAAALMISYKYDVEKQIPQIRAELEARKAQSAVQVAEEVAEKEWETWRN